MFLDWLKHYTDWQNRWFRSHKKRRVLEKGFENCSSLWVKYLKMMVISAYILNIFLILLKSYLCVMQRIWCFYSGLLITLCDGDSHRVKTNQSMCIAGRLFGFYVVWDFLLGSFWTFCTIQWRECISLVLSILFNWI